MVSVGEMKHAAQHTGNSSALGVTMEDEMTLDAPASSASFDDTLDMVISLICLIELLLYQQTSTRPLSPNSFIFDVG